ncbi:elongation factor 1-delta-like isoform X2 [Haliotis rubra]|uniref:elongation factor 1-delta-like isoform X2 n=1 Tax=Haliotis rubra TaxID=36100 RepID=UPI001EE61B7F|nr:elongation factor 1-delta-like isoform X2 [Haliotis rubra]
MASPLMNESVWFNQQKFEKAEANYQQILAGTATPGQGKQGGSSLVNEIAQARQEISKLLQNPITGGGGSAPPGKMDSLERENRELRKVTDELRAMVLKLENRVSALERGAGVPAASAAAPAAAAKPSKPAAADDDDDDDDDFDMFGSDDEEEAAEKERLQAERVAAYKAKKASKPALVAKSNIILEVKPWDDETDMKELEQKVRKVSTDGLKWGSSKLVPVGYGINKLQIMCVVEDDKVGTDFLEEAITAHEDYVQSVDVVAFNKI